MAVDYQALRTLLETHPTFATATDQELTDWCNETVVQQTAERLASDALYELIDGGEFTALSADAQNEVWNILLLFASSGIPTAAGTRARARLIQIFGTGSATINNVVAAITFLVSRATSANVGADEVRVGEVQHARTL